MRIVSVNAWGGARYDDLAAWLPTAGADVVCLQEVTRTAGLSGACCRRTTDCSWPVTPAR